MFFNPHFSGKRACSARSPYKLTETKGGYGMEHNYDQSIGCEVTSCRFNEHGAHCALSKICVRPARNTATGRENESLCGSYEHRD
jgi:hypothetical protein